MKLCVIHHFIRSALFAEIKTIFRDRNTSFNKNFDWQPLKIQRTSDGGNGNLSVSLPIILIKIKVDQMLPSSYIRSLLVSIL